MDVQEIIERLNAAGTDPFNRALATLDIVLSDQDPDLRETIEAAAIPHWFDREILARLVGSDDHLETLIQLPMVETFAARGGWNVHETTRLAVRRHLYNRQPDRFRELSTPAAKCFPGDSPHERVETLYHRLVSNPLEAGKRLARLYSEWNDAGRFEALQALGQALDELLRFTPPAMSARAYCGIFLATISRDRVALNETERLVREALHLLADESDDLAETNARQLLGESLAARGRLSEALIEYRQAHIIVQRGAQRDEGENVLQRNLSVIHNKIGDIEAAQGDAAAALKSYRAGLAIIERLAERDTENLNWQRDLSVCHDMIGNVQVAQHYLDDGLKSYQTSLAIAERLAAKDPDNTVWQRDLSISHEKIGDVEAGQGNLDAALKSYQVSLTIRQRLTGNDSGNTAWRDLSVSYSKIGRVEAKRGDLAAALKAYQADIAIAERLAEHDSANTDWQRDLFYSHWMLAATFEGLNQVGEALEHAKQSLEIAERLAELDPTNATWRDDLAEARQLVARLQAVQQ